MSDTWWSVLLFFVVLLFQALHYRLRAKLSDRLADARRAGVELECALLRLQLAEANRRGTGWPVHRDELLGCRSCGVGPGVACVPGCRAN